MADLHRVTIAYPGGDPRDTKVLLDGREMVLRSVRMEVGIDHVPTVEMEAPVVEVTSYGDARVRFAGLEHVPSFALADILRDRGWECSQPVNGEEYDVWLIDPEDPS